MIFRHSKTGLVFEKKLANLYTSLPYGYLYINFLLKEIRSVEEVENNKEYVQID